MEDNKKDEALKTNEELNNENNTEEVKEAVSEEKVEEVKEDAKEPEPVEFSLLISCEKPAGIQKICCKTREKQVQYHADLN